VGGWVIEKETGYFIVTSQTFIALFIIPPQCLSAKRQGWYPQYLGEEPQSGSSPPIMMFHMLPGSMLYPSPNGGRNDPYSM
jgi:hypothetical protein